jgi:hypothetical protein
MSSKPLADQNDTKREVVIRIALEAGALEHCAIHGTYFDPMDDEALERAEARAKELIESEDSTVEIFGGDADALVELLEDVVADADENCHTCEAQDDED